MLFDKKNASTILLITALLFCLTIIFTVSGSFIQIFQETSGKPINDDNLVIGFVELVSESEWRDQATASVKTAAKEHNIQLLTIKSDRTMEAQKEAIRALIAYKVNILIFSPVNGSGWDNVLMEARSANIPVILSDRNLTTDVEGAVYTYVGSSAVRQGEAAALFIRDHYQDTPDQVNIVKCIGIVGCSTSVERSRGIQNIFSRDAKFDIYYNVSADDLFSKARELFDSFLKNNQDERKTDVFIGYSDAMTCGVIEAMEENSIRPGEDIIIVSIGGTSQALQMLKEGKINCIIEDDYHLGETLIRSAVNIFEGRTVPEEIILESSVMTQQTLAEGK